MSPNVGTGLTPPSCGFRPCSPSPKSFFVAQHLIELPELGPRGCRLENRVTQSAQQRVLDLADAAQRTGAAHDSGRSLPAQAFISPQRGRHTIFRVSPNDLFETPGKHNGVLDGLAGSLPQVGGCGMGCIAE